MSFNIIVFGLFAAIVAGLIGTRVITILEHLLPNTNKAKFVALIAGVSLSCLLGFLFAEALLETLVE